MSSSAIPTKTVLWIVGIMSFFAWTLTVPLASWVASPKPDKQAIEGYTWPENPGVVGDSFGPLTCLFSGFSFCLLIYSFMREREDATEEKKLLQSQLIEAKVEAMSAKLPFFVITWELNAFTIANEGSSIYNLCIKVADEQGNLIYDRQTHSLKTTQSDVMILYGASVKYSVKLEFVTTDGLRLEESHVIDHASNDPFSCSQREAHAESFRKRLWTQHT